MSSSRRLHHAMALMQQEEPGKCEDSFQRVVEVLRSNSNTLVEIQDAVRWLAPQPRTNEPTPPPSPPPQPSRKTPPSRKTVLPETPVQPLPSSVKDLPTEASNAISEEKLLALYDQVRQGQVPAMASAEQQHRWFAEEINIPRHRVSWVDDEGWVAVEDSKGSHFVLPDPFMVHEWNWCSLSRYYGGTQETSLRSGYSIKRAARVERGVFEREGFSLTKVASFEITIGEALPG